MSAQRLMDREWRASSGAVRDVYADFNKLTFDITVMALFGEEVATSEQVRHANLSQCCPAVSDMI